MRPYGRRGFIFIFFGARELAFPDGTAVEAVCPRCRQRATFHGKSARTWFTLFFLPVFPMSRKRSICQCSACGAKVGMSAAALADGVAAAQNRSQQQGTQQAIAMYNSLRASPANSVTLHELMGLYASMREFDQAVSAAGQFPQALNASEQCMSTLGRVYLELGRHDDAIQWFDAAIARNPHYGEASYYKALSLLTRTPPDARAAVPAARAARTAGYPNAEALLKEAESRN